MRKKSFRKTISLVLCTAMSVIMTGTPVLADTFTDGSQLIVSEDAGEETPEAVISDAEDEDMMESEHTFEIEDNCEDSGYVGFSSENESGFSDDSVLAAQTEGKPFVYLDQNSRNDNNTGESATSAVNTLSKAMNLVAQNGVIYLLNPVTINSKMTLSNVTFCPGSIRLSCMLQIQGDVTLNNIKIYNETPDGKSCQFSNDPIRVTGTLTIGEGTRIESFLGKSCIYVSQGTLNLNGGKIQGDTQNTVKHGGGIYAKNATVNVYGGIISGHSATYGGGIYADNSSININGGQIIDSQATKGGGIYANGGNVYINGGRISGHRATYGGGIYLDQASIYIKEGGINDNQATKGGAIYTEGTKAGICLLNIEGGTISGNCANESGAGIFAICSKGTRDGMKVEISGGTIAHNYSGTGENLEENAIVLMGEDPNLTEDTGFADLYLSGSPVITGSVTLADDYCAADSKNYSPLIYVADSFKVNKPILISPIHGDDPNTPAVIYANESIAENYQSHFCCKEGSNRELVKNGATLNWVVKVNVRLRTFDDITDYPVPNLEKSIYLKKGEKVSPNDVPEAAVIPGYERTGWLNESNNTTWDPASEITSDMEVREVWALVKPTVQVSADKEKGCPSSKIVLTARATHVLDDNGIKYSYQWYKDNQTLDDQTGETLTVSEAGTYIVEVTATSKAGASSKETASKETASIVIPAFDHSYSWQFDKTNHWEHCSIGNENTTQEAHTFGNWVVTKQASIGVEGEKERTCKVCGYTEKETIPSIYIPSYPVTGIKVSQDTLMLTKKDETAQLSAEVVPSYADNTRVTWKSSDEKVATVDEKGKVTAVGNGTATITVTSVSGNYTAIVAVTVKIPVEIERITIETEREILTKIGESTELKVKIEPENADAQKLIWKSGDEMIAVVDENGKVTAIGNGTVIITVTTEDGKNTASITITVKIPDEPVINKTKGFGRLKVRSVNQTKTSITLEWSKLDGVDGYFVYGNRCNTKTKTYKYQKLATITNGRTWTHKNLKKGTFYKYIVKAYKIVDGKKVVTDTSASIHVITQGGKYGIAKSVSVTKIGNKKNVSKITLKKGKTAQITAKEIKKDKKIRHHRNLCYESSNTAVATVTPEGLIQAVGKGTCTIWVYAQNGVYAALTVTVK